MKKENREKNIKARQDARPKKFLQILGYSIFVDSRQWTVQRLKQYRYFSTLEFALWYIADQLARRTNELRNLEEAIKHLERVNADFLKALSTALAGVKQTKSHD